MGTDYYAQIDNYLDNSLNTEDKSAFEKAMQKDDALQEAVKLHMLEKDALSLFVEKEYAKKIKGWSEELDLKNQIESARVVPLWQRIPRKFAVAASVLLLALAGIWWYANQFTNTSILASAYVNPEEDLRSGFLNIPEEEVNKIYEEGKSAYLAGNYEIAIRNFQQVPDNYEMPQYFLAHIYYQRNDFANAIETFKKTAAKQGRFEQKAEFYQLISQLATNQLDENFYLLLRKMSSDPTHSFYQEAQQIQTKLNSNWRIFE